MANEQNIIPHRYTSDQDRAEAAKNGRKGGVASGAVRRAKREARETAKLVLDFKPDLPPQMLETMRRMGLKKNISPDMRYICTLAIMQRAMKGDMQCYKYMIELAGETAEAAIMDVKAEEVARRSAYGKAQEEEPTIDRDGIRQRMSEMTDEELAQYEKLCALFGYEGGEGHE